MIDKANDVRLDNPLIQEFFLGHGKALSHFIGHQLSPVSWSTNNGFGEI
jgi:hypothetical protein